MKKTVLIVVFLLFTLSVFAQETKKLKIKSPSFKETFYVLKSNESVKHGLYKKEKNGKMNIKGHFESGVKTSVWEYYTFKGEIAQKYNFSTNQLLFDKFEGTHENNDESSFSRPQYC